MCPSKNTFAMYMTIMFILPLSGFDDPPASSNSFVFKDVTQSSGLIPGINRVQGHGAAWGDVNGDGWPELYLGTFHYENTKPNQLFTNDRGRFPLAQQESVQISSRTTGVLFVDLDNDGDLDLYVGSMPAINGTRQAERLGYPLRGCSLFENDGKGQFTDISKDNGACPEFFGGRSATVLDYDGDGLLDLLVGEDPIPGYNGSETKTSRLFQNKGQLKFEDVTAQVNIPTDAAGLGVATADVNADGFPDIFLASTIGNYLLLNDGKGQFAHPDGLKSAFVWEDARGDNMVCGVVMADVNNDGLIDVLIGQHYNSPWVDPVANRLYLNRGLKNGIPQFEDVTESVGLIPIPLKAPHVEIQDFDNDGWPDIYASIVKWKEDQPYPLIFRNLGNNKNSLPQFVEYTLEVNDFPTDEDRKIKRAGTFFEKMISERKIIYSAAGPTCDYDRDGRLDIFLASWWAEVPSMLLRNETKPRHWIDVTVNGVAGMNWMGIGSRVEIYEAGQAENLDKRLGYREITTGFGYASSQQAIAHFGLGDRNQCDIVVTLPFGKGKFVRQNVKANQRINLNR